MVKRVPRIRDPEASRSAILDAATRVFARRGFAGATIQEISDEAGVKKPLIYHHFGSKGSLYAAVKQTLLEALPRLDASAARTTDFSGDPPLEACQILDLIRDHELLLRINAWAYLEGDSGFWPEVIELVLELRRRIEQAQKQQETIRLNIDLETLSIMLLGLVSFGPQIRSRIASDGKRGSEYIRQLIALTIEGQAPRP
ncbi:TetR/AcrR family transcriptional regulator [Singulisphaera acidiphila]|uniref:Transcriptional regulator n=1 Tax=Singulisphaera acidiphila (strain ATCC BAA-1392 / DSM 18658 / VKM B-2454 / MOB10) TaxID=886293 RepID=L0DS36_SINAD|nr:TetR/AcrR family transcriptional regulator [Singulisphaera acidiphila]AGA31216.1 transcriptional regulator [Singulisphaera acidiphila DSM 18658]